MKRKKIISGLLALFFLQGPLIQAGEEIIKYSGHDVYKKASVSICTTNNQNKNLVNIAEFCKPIFNSRILPGMQEGYLAIRIRNTGYELMNLKDFTLEVQIKDHYQTVCLSKKDNFLEAGKKKIVKIKFKIPRLITDTLAEFTINHQNIPVTLKKAMLKVKQGDESDVEIESEVSSDEEFYKFNQPLSKYKEREVAKENLEIILGGLDKRESIDDFEKGISKNIHIAESPLACTQSIQTEKSSHAEEKNEHLTIVKAPKVVRPKEISRKGDVGHIVIPKGKYDRDDHTLKLDMTDPRLEIETLPKEIKPQKIEANQTEVVAHLSNKSQTLVKWTEPHLRSENILKGTNILGVEGKAENRILTEKEEAKLALPSVSQMIYPTSADVIRMSDGYLIDIPKGAYLAERPMVRITDLPYISEEQEHISTEKDSKIIKPQAVSRKGDIGYITIPKGIYAWDTHVLKLNMTDPRLEIETLPKETTLSTIQANQTEVVARLSNKSQTLVKWTEPDLHSENILKGTSILGVKGKVENRILTGKEEAKLALPSVPKMIYPTSADISRLPDRYLIDVPRGAYLAARPMVCITELPYTKEEKERLAMKKAPAIVQPQKIFRKGNTSFIVIPKGMYDRDDHTLKLDMTDPRIQLNEEKSATSVVEKAKSESQMQGSFVKPNNMIKGIYLLPTTEVSKPKFQQFSLDKTGGKSYRVGTEMNRYVFSEYLFTIPSGSHQAIFNSEGSSSSGWTYSKSNFCVNNGDNIDTRLEIGLKLQGRLDTIHLSGYPIYGFSSRELYLDLLNFNIDLKNKQYSIMLENRETDEPNHVVPFRRYQEITQSFNMNDEYEVYLIYGTYERNDRYMQGRETRFEIKGNISIF